MSDELNINKEMILQILQEDLQKRNYLHKVGPRESHEWAEATETNIMLTGDESWVFQYDPEMKRQNMQWTS
jgi:hypothetical protein